MFTILVGVEIVTKRSDRSVRGGYFAADGGYLNSSRLADTRYWISRIVLAVQPRFSFRFLPICIVYTSIREGGGAALQTGHPARSVAQSNHAAMWSINKGHGGGKLKGGSVWPSHHRLKP